MPPRRASASKRLLVLATALAILVDAQQAAGVGVKPNGDHLVNASSSQSSIPGTLKVSDIPEVPTGDAQSLANVGELEQGENSPTPSPARAVDAATDPLIISSAASSEATAVPGEHSFVPVPVATEERKVAQRAGASSGEADATVEVSAPECEPVGPCLMCHDEEMTYNFCADTGRRQEVLCRVARANAVADTAPGPATGADVHVAAEVGHSVGDAGGMGYMRGSATFQACTKTEEEEIDDFIKFWLAMLALGIVSCIGMRRRQQKGISLYDRRAK